MTSSRTNRVICDWLDLTYSPIDAPYPVLNRMLLDAGFFVESRDRVDFVYTHPAELQGVLKVGQYRGTYRVSISGAICRQLRALGIWEDLLFELGQVPHRVTRLDAAMDLPVDGAAMIAHLRSTYPEGSVNLRRKAVKTTCILEVRPDGRESGTWYAGRRSKARVTARVYDKALEALSKRGEVMPPTTRVEVTASGGDSGATLRDAMLPDALFWHIAAPAILKAPEGAPMWKPNTEMGWTPPPPRDFNAAEMLKRRVESLAILDALAVVADELGSNGRAYLVSLIAKRLEAHRASGDAEEAA